MRKLISYNLMRDEKKFVENVFRKEQKKKSKNFRECNKEKKLIFVYKMYKL